MMPPDPLAALSIYAEVSVGLVGFSGIVIAFGRRSRGELSRLESRRLSNLFACSGFALVLSLLGIAIVQHPTIDVRLLWKCGSAILLVVGTSWLVHDWWTIHRLEAEEKASINRYILYPFNFVAVLCVLLLLANVFVMAEAWPLFLGLAYLIAFALQQFILLIRTGYGGE